MGTYPPEAKKREMKASIDQKVYDDFIKLVSRKGFAPQVIIQRMMEKFIQTGGQI
ncbi:MAG TPA: hypothetical protein VMC80_00435 [Patescibacteria group bacterium]|nr:hypothetical protein [Patescibacteria group bacterium]